LHQLIWMAAIFAYPVVLGHATTTLVESKLRHITCTP
jgi:hypothetical protein